MMRSRVRAAGWQVTVWEEASGSGHSQDDVLVQAGARELRVAAIDGATPADRTPRAAGIDGAAWAASVTRAALKARGPLTAALEAANAHLHRDDLEPSARPQASVCAASVQPDGAAVVVLAGDCEAWVRHADTWRRVFAADQLARDARDGLTAWCAAHPAHTMRELIAAEDRLLGSPSAWKTTPVGRFASVKTRTVTVRAFDELVLATDGARLAARGDSTISGWLERLRAWERATVPEVGDGRSVKPHDDVTVLAVRRAHTDG